MLRHALHVALGTSIVVASSRALADVRVERGSGAASCPDTAVFAQRLAGDGAAEEIAVRFERDAAGYRSTFVMADGRRRVLTDDGSSCDALADATVLAVKLALDREPAPPAKVIVPLPEVEPPDVVTLPPRAPRTPVAEVSASGTIAFGIGSPFAPGVRLGGALVLGRWSVGITGVALPAREREVGDGTVDISVLGGGLEGCGRAPLGSVVSLALCARLEAMRISGSAIGFARNEEHAIPLFAGTLLRRARARIAGPLSGFVEAGAVLPFVRERFGIDTLGVVYDPPVVAATTGIGVLVDFE